MFEILLASVVLGAIVIFAVKMNREDEIYVAGYEGALLAIRNGADPYVVYMSSRGPGSLNRGARDAARTKIDHI